MKRLPGSLGRMTMPRKADLAQAVAVPSQGGGRQAWYEDMSPGLDPGRLATYLREAVNGDPTAYFALAEEIEEKDLRYRAALGQRKRAVTRRNIQVMPASDAARDMEIAAFVEQWVQRGALRDELTCMLDAIGKGVSVSEILWETSERQWWPKDICWVEPRWLDLDPIDRRSLLLRQDTGAARPLADWPAKFIVHEAKDKAGLPIRGGLARVVIWPYLFKNPSIKDWLVFCEVYGQPLRIGKYGAGATEEQKRTLATALRRMGSDAAAMIPEGMMIELVSAKTNSDGKLWAEFVEYLDTSISILVMGQNLTSEVDSGSYAAAMVHAGVALDLEDADAHQLAVTLNQQLIRPLVDFNYGPVSRYPQLHLEPVEKPNLGALGDYLAKTVPLGLKVSQRWVREQGGMPEPDDEADVLRVMAPPTPAATPAASEAASAMLERLISAADGHGHTPDSIDRMVTDVIQNRRGPDAAAAMLSPYVAAIADAASLEDALDRLDLIQADDRRLGPLGELLAQSMFAARMAGETAAPLQDDQELEAR